MSKAIYSLPDNRKLKLCDDVLKMMFSYAQDHKKSPESGGILIGRILNCESHIVVDDASEPMKSDVQTRYRFIRKSVGHQEFFNEHWENSEGRCYYLGEWHTHPEANPTPSIIDKQEWGKLLYESIQDQNQLYFIIVGTKTLVIWYGERKVSGNTFLRIGSFNRNDIQN
ncbi:Mov34/MPN/PAD-1 family protein [Paenibacillus gallinarum]|uniref:Mov34/MPN/PAD-1 family protein n=1 Tax=Paenibacillus gallinarum TaxID=2762232 RepID=A0ABR8T1D2_9BACL|nr:Mov34/MPN/PAD-1 family protein [Paenibacillus gallinarum]MBD7969564.1 Mov34/MPN/PAD-1 family protein [Paenibacillus gallinarum]